jgi:hypothetical protein
MVTAIEAATLVNRDPQHPPGAIVRCDNTGNLRKLFRPGVDDQGVSIGRDLGAIVRYSTNHLSSTTGWTMLKLKNSHFGTGLPTDEKTNQQDQARDCP